MPLDGRRQWTVNVGASLRRPQEQPVAPNGITTEAYHVSDSQPGIPQKQDDGFHRCSVPGYQLVARFQNLLELGDFQRFNFAVHHFRWLATINAQALKSGQSVLLAGYPLNEISCCKWALQAKNMARNQIHRQGHHPQMAEESCSR